jgi:hypothetical protein
MTHVHYCDVAGHEWECDKPECECICGERMEEGDHSACPIELRACPRHLEGLQPGEVAGGVPINFPEDTADKIKRAAEQRDSYAAVCFWCGYGYDEYTRKAENEHFAYHCPDAPEALRESAKKRLTLNDYDSCESSEGQEGDAETK